MVDQCGMGVYNALGCAGGAGRVDDRRRVRAVDVVLHRRQQSRVNTFGPLDTGDVEDHVPQLGCGGVEQPIVGVQRGARQHLGQALHIVVGSVGRSRQQDFGVAVNQLLAQFARGGEGRKGYDDGADPRGGQHPDDKRDTVGVEQTDMSSLAGTEVDETARHDRGQPFGIGVADAFGVADQQGMIGSAAGLLAQHLADGGPFTRHGQHR